MLDAWWKTLSARLESGPAALHRLPETVAHIAEALWMQALEEGKRRATLEELDKQRLEVRSHVLTLREGELDSRLRDRDRTIEVLNSRLRELTGALRKEQATREPLAQQMVALKTPAPPRRKARAPQKWNSRKRSATVKKAVVKRVKKQKRR